MGERGERDARAMKNAQLRPWILLVSLCGACAAPATQSTSLAKAQSAPQRPVAANASNQTATPTPTVLDADQLFKRGEWSAALEIYRRELAARPDDLKLLNSSAHCSHLLGDFEASLAAWTTMAKQRERDPVARYNVACANARLGRTDAAFSALDDALTRGFRDVAMLSSDADLESLRADPRFASALERARKLGTSSTASAPRTPSPELEQFTFWVGSWDVFTADGARAGSSRIERILDGFVILENWTGADGLTGKSFNTFDVAQRSWRQHWVDNRGNVMDFHSGRLEGDVLTFQSEWKQPDGSPMRRRMSFTDLGERGVRQFSERSADDGGTWAPEYELFYRAAKQ